MSAGAFAWESGKKESKRLFLFKQLGYAFSQRRIVFFAVEIVVAEHPIIQNDVENLGDGIFGHLKR